MIKINLQSTKEEFEINGIVFIVDFSDSKLKEYFEFTQELYGKEMEIEKEFSGIEHEKDFNKVANAIVTLLPKQANGYKLLFDKIFGEGKGEEIYKLCGESTPNMKTVFEIVWNTILDKMQNVESEGQKAVDKYVKNDNKKKNK